MFTQDHTASKLVFKPRSFMLLNKLKSDLHTISLTPVMFGG